MINNKTVQDFLKSKNLEDFSEEIISELEVNIKKILNEKIKENVYLVNKWYWRRWGDRGEALASGVGFP